EAVLFPAAARVGGMTPFTVGLAVGLASRKVPEMVEQYMPTLKALGVVDQDNMIDIDLLHGEAVKSLERNPIVVAGYRPDRGDLDRLREIMMRHGG
ncbi:MAG: hypothetical protein ACI4SV_01240, partial [Duodenibacillus sp.]